MNNKDSRLAVLIPAWNPGDRLQQTLESISRQVIDCEIFIVDDGSYPPIKVAKVMNRKPIHLIRCAANGGITKALNIGLKEILQRGFAYIARHDCGDIDLNDRLLKQLAFMDQHASVMLLGSSVKFASPDGTTRFIFKAPESKQDIQRKMKYSPGIVHPSCMFRSALFADMDIYSEEYPHAEDYELFLRASERHEVRNIAEVLVISRYDVSGITIANRKVSLQSRLRLQCRYFNYASIHAYLGIVQSILLYVFPYSLVCTLKRSSSYVREKRSRLLFHE